MKCIPFLQMVLVSLLIVAVTSSVAFAADDVTDIDDAIENAVNDPTTNDAALEYWQSTLVSKGKGACLHDGVLFLISKVKFNKRSAESLNKAQREAKQDALRELEEWCRKEADTKSKPVPNSENQRIAWMCLDKLFPGWRYAEWSFRGDTRIIVNDPDFNSGVVTVVMTVNEVDAQESARRCRPRCSTADVNSQVVRYFTNLPKNCEMDAAYKALGLLDLTDSKGVTKDVVTEYASIESSIRKYLVKSELAKQFKQEVAELSAPIVVTNRIEKTNPQGTETIVTEEIRTIVRRARMQQLFLSGGTLTNAACARMESGVKAEAVAFDNAQSNDTKLQTLRTALCENPGDASLWNLYGRCLGEAGDKMAAIICYRNSLKIDPRFEYAAVNLAVTYRELRCPNLSVGLALYARGIATQKWSVVQSEALLK